VGTGINGFAADIAVVEAPHVSAWQSTALWQRLTGSLARYLAAGVIALCADTAFLMALVRVGVSPTWAAAAGFTLGIAVNWLVASRLMFADGIAAPGPERRRQLVIFVATAMVGMALTMAIVGGGAAMGISVHGAKLIAVGVSFVVTTGMRHVLVFGQPRFG